MNNDISFNELIQQINIKTRKYAKKQIKWFNKEKFDLTIDVNVDDKSLILKKIINNFYNIK